jgi:hypothetical protein
VLLASTGCGTTATSTSTPSGLTLLPSADAFHSAVVATRALGTARISVQGTRQEASGPATMRADGVSVLGNGMGDLTWTTPSGTYREIVNNKGIYGTTDGSAWTQWSLDDPTPTSGFVDPLRGLGVLREATLAGHEDLGSVPTTRYSGWLPLDQREAALLGIPAAEDLTDLREDVTVWIDDFGHVIRVDRSVAGRTGSPIVTTSSVMSEFSLQLDLTSPSGNVTLGTRALP